MKHKSLSQMRYHDPYTPAKRWGLEFVTVELYRPILGVSVRTLGARDWDGSCYTNEAAFFYAVPGGWEYQGATYHTLLRAVRQYYTRAMRDARKRHLAAAAA